MPHAVKAMKEPGDYTFDAPEILDFKWPRMSDHIRSLNPVPLSLDARNGDVLSHENGGFRIKDTDYTYHIMKTHATNVGFYGIRSKAAFFDVMHLDLGGTMSYAMSFFGAIDDVLIGSILDLVNKGLEGAQVSALYSPVPLRRIPRGT